MRSGFPFGTIPPDVTSAMWPHTTTNGTPPAPTNLSATAVSADGIDLAWEDNSTNETGFRVYRSPNGVSSWTLIATTGADATSYSSTSLTQSTTYYYRVRAQNGSGVSGYSNETSATTPVSVSIVATNYSRTTIYSGVQADNYQAGDPSWTSWVGTWLMPNGDLMVGVTQASGREQPFHNNPSPYNYSQLDIDVVYLTGYGFPLHRGGPMLYADMQGLYGVARRMTQLAANPHADSAFWQPAPLLAKLAAEGKTFNG